MSKLVDETLGWEQLCDLQLSQKEIEAATDVPQSVVSALKNRKCLPSRKTSKALAAVGIEPAAWDAPPSRPHVEQAAATGTHGAGQ